MRSSTRLRLIKRRHTDRRVPCPNSRGIRGIPAETATVGPEPGTNRAVDPDSDTTLSLRLTAGKSGRTGGSIMLDAVLHGGIIHVMDADYRTVEALGIRDGRIAVVGSNHDVLGLTGHGTTRIDL